MPGELRTSMDLAASPEAVWDVLMDVPAYPSWTGMITAAEGTMAEGGRVTFRFPPMNALVRSTVPARVLEVTPCRRLRFALRLARLGVPGLLDTEHTMTVVAQDDGVRLWLDIKFRGLLLPLMTGPLNRERAPAFGAVPAALGQRIEAVEATRSG